MAGRGAAAGGGIPTYVATSRGGINNAAVTATRPTGTQVGDRLFLIFGAPAAQSTPPTLTGWTKLSGYDQVSSPKFAIYSRIADLTATDEPSIAGTGWFTGWSQTALRGAATISVAVTLTSGASSSPMVSPVVVTTAPNSLILLIGFAGNTTAVTAPTGGPVDRHRGNANFYAVGVATQDMAAAGTGSAASWALGGAQNWISYGLALTA